MTFLGKLLVFLVLILGVGAAVTSTVVYTQRPVWYDPAPTGGVERGQHHYTFAGLTAEVNDLGKAAAAASATWGTDLRGVVAAEQLRNDRAAKMQQLLALAKNADPAKKEAGFFNLKADPVTKLLDLDNRADVVKGPDDADLGGSEKLLGRFEADRRAIEVLTQNSVKLRADLKVLEGQTAATQAETDKQGVIRDRQREQAAYLGSFEVNLAGQQKTATDRKNQLDLRLKQINGN